jgi:GTP-binding protein Era
MQHKAGYVNILGKPNAGKSSLMNAMLGEKLSIITSKAQTTRHRILGIVNTPETQLIFSDTPGIVKPIYKLHQKMMDVVQESLKDGDIFLLVIDAADKESMEADSELLEKVHAKLQKVKVPVLIAVNKIDLIDQPKLEAIVEILKTKFPKAEVYPVSALHNFNLDNLHARLVELLPESPPYYDKEDISDKPTRFFVAEMIREKILAQYDKEVPYSVEVVINSYKEEAKIIKIQADIFVIRDSQKSIIIGNGGKAIKKLGTDARIAMEKFLGNKVFLELFVKVKKDWRDNETNLKSFGY